MVGIKKIKAFTLGEMLVVLLLTVIVVGAAFTVLRLVQQQMYGIDKNYERNTELNLLSRSLWIDFNQSDGVWYDHKLNTLHFKNEYAETTYQFAKNQIIKETDTFTIQVTQLEFFFNGDAKEQGEIDAMDLIVQKDSVPKRLFVYKTNAATSFLNE